MVGPIDKIKAAPSLTARAAGAQELLAEARDFYQRTLRPVSPEQLSAADAVFAFSFGQGPGNKPGRTNEGLAAVCTHLRQLTRGGLPVFAQWEISDALAGRGRPRADHDAVVRGEYLSTIGVIEQFIEQARAIGQRLETVVVVGQRDHAFRIQKLLEARGFETVLGSNTVAPPGGWSGTGCDRWGYDATSTQPWTASRKRFLEGEETNLVEALDSGAISGS